MFKKEFPRDREGQITEFQTYRI